MNFLDRAIHRPQTLWLRKALFQIHLWTGIALGLYVVAISVSGSAIVFRNELYKSLWPGPTLVPVSGPRLSHEALKKDVEREWPGYSVSYIWDAKRPNEATEVWIERSGVKNPKTKGRLLDPFTGRDLGPSRPALIGVLAWMADLHTNLLAGDTGREINGILAILVVILSVSGLVVWWPGAGRVRRSLTIDFKSGASKSSWKRLNWDLHSAIGFWMFALVFMWGVTGVYLIFPRPFQIVVNHFSTLRVYAPLQSSVQPPARQSSLIRVADEVVRRRPPRGSNGDVFLRWFYYLHFGNFGGWQWKAVWVALGLVPPFLFVTGAIMWWNRVLSREARLTRRRAQALRRNPGGASLSGVPS